MLAFRDSHAARELAHVFDANRRVDVARAVLASAVTKCEKSFDLTAAFADVEAKQCMIFKCVNAKSTATDACNVCVAIIFAVINEESEFGVIFDIEHI